MEDLYYYPLILMLAGIVMTVFLMEGLYRLSENTIVSLLVFGILTAVQFTPAFKNSVFVRWNLPQELPVSDTVGSAGILRILIYTRSSFYCAVSVSGVLLRSLSENTNTDRSDLFWSV